MVIQWEPQGISGDATLSLSRSGGKAGTFEPIGENIPNKGLFVWTVAGPASPNCALKIVPLNEPSKFTTQGLFLIGGISVSPSALAITEPDSANRFNIRLNAAPTFPVVVPLYASDPEGCRLSTLSAALTESNWRTGVDVTVTAVDDDVHDGDKTVFIRTGPAESDDPAFSGIDPPDVEVEILDDDDPQTLSIVSVEPNVGPLGQDLDVTIYGAGFDEGTAVQLTGLGVSDAYSDEDIAFQDGRLTLVLKSPPTVGDYTLTVINDAERYSLESAVAFEDPQPIEALSGKKAIVVAGGVASPLENALWPATRACADKAYMEIHHQGYAPDRIRYLSPEEDPIDLTGDGENDRYDAATVENLENAIADWAGGDAGTREVLIYLTDHGREGAFGITGSDWLAAETLDGWLDALQTGRDIRVIVIYDACRSGSFISKLKPPEGKERYVIASARSDAEAYFAHEGRLSFSRFFWDSVHREGGLFRAFRSAYGKTGDLDQTPLIDLDGDGVGDAVTDEHLLADVPVGIGKVAASDLIDIGRVGGDAAVDCANTGTIWADQLDIPNAMEAIWADIVSPPPEDADPDAPVTDVHRVRLSDPDEDGRYSGVYRDFRKNGTYTLIFAAKDKKGRESTHATARVFRSCDLTAIPGDLNGDERVTLADGVIAIQTLCGLEPRTFRGDYRSAGVDVTGNDVVDMGEAIYVFQQVAGVRD